MGDVLPFRTREVYIAEQVDHIAVDTEPLTAIELNRVLIELSYEQLDTLITKYKATGKWNAQAEKLMRRVFDDTNAVCAAIAGVKQHGSSTQTERHAGSIRVPVRNPTSPVRIADLGTANNDGGTPAGA